VAQSSAFTISILSDGFIGLQEFRSFQVLRLKASRPSPVTALELVGCVRAVGATGRNMRPVLLADCAACI
jgi:hypothetical protein